MTNALTHHFSWHPIAQCACHGQVYRQHQLASSATVLIVSIKQPGLGILTPAVDVGAHTYDLFGVVQYHMVSEHCICILKQKHRWWKVDSQKQHTVTQKQVTSNCAIEVDHEDALKPVNSTYFIGLAVYTYRPPKT